MPCHNGLIQASGWINPGSCEIGKKVPENSVIGSTTKRNTAVKALDHAQRWLPPG